MPSLANKSKELAAECIDFGVLVAPETMLIKRTRHSSHRGMVRMVLHLGRREIDIRFPSVYSDKTRAYKFVIPIDQVFDLSQHQSQADSKTSFILTLQTPPHFYKKLSGGIASTHDDAAFAWREEDSWLRQTNVLGHEHEVAQLRSRPISLKNHPEGIVNIGRWTTYRVTIDDRSVDKEKYRVFRAALRDYNVTIASNQNFGFAHEGDPAWDLLDRALAEYESGPSLSTQNAFKHTLQELLHSKKNDSYLPFPVRYQLEVCISNGWINEHNLTREFLEALAKTDNERAKHILECVALNKVRIFDPMEIFKLRVIRLPSMKSRIPDNCVLVRSAIITPSTMMLNTPYLEMTNRVVRRYREHADRFLRVRFEDDERRGFARINATSQRTMDEILSKVFRTLTSGIDIGDRHYEFLAFGNSQLREHGAYFFAGLPAGPTASHIRAWMGRFEHERIVAKHAARIGQCFSTTRAIRNAGFPHVRKSDLIDDVERNGFNFTDGVGKISLFYAETIAKELRIRGPAPSVYQFRMAGCKGVLAVAPELGATKVRIRKSQCKFETTYSGMEIIRWSEYWVATLNRQLILVLSDLGVPDDIFLVMQDKEIQLMERAMIQDSAALEALTGHVDPNRMTLTIAGLVQAGFRRSNEPFVTSLLRLWRAWSTKYLKEKARLAVREGACVLGCTDETGILKGHFEADKVYEDDEPEAKMAKLPQVFIQVTSPDTGHRKVIEGLCAIARNPSLHPGDIRVVRAVDVPALHHLVDVLVLPQTGDRDIASMCSGGDLDGDDYVVIWDRRLLPRMWNAEPMDYTPPVPTPLGRDVTQTDITRFFVKYIKNDFLPKIAHAHLAWADYLDEGIRHEKCLELARLHSKAVDYPKSGQPAHMPKALDAKEWPHFMEKKGRRSYRSRKVLGQLYDAVDRVAFIPNYDAPFDERILNACEVSAETMRDARELKHEYDTSLRRIMAQHAIKTEFEVWSTFVLDHSKASKDYKFHEEVGQLSESLKRQYHDAVIDKAGGKGWTNLVPWAVAMYRVTKEELEAAKLRGNDESMPFISFPWLLCSTLIQIGKGVDSLAHSRQDWTGDIPDVLLQSAFDSEVQVYGDPYQPGANDSREDIAHNLRKQELLIDESGEDVAHSLRKVELSIGEEQAPACELTSSKLDSGPDVASITLRDAHHISNEGFPVGSYAPNLSIPPQPTSEQFARIERIINHPTSACPSRRISPDSSSALKKHATMVSVDEGLADFANHSTVDLSEPRIQSYASAPASLGDLERASCGYSGTFKGESLTDKEFFANAAHQRRFGGPEQPSSYEPGILIDIHQAHGQEPGLSPKGSMTRLLSEELVGLQLEPAPLLKLGGNEYGNKSDENRRLISPSSRETRQRRCSSPAPNPRNVQLDRNPGEGKALGQGSLSAVVANGFTGMSTSGGNSSQQESRFGKHSLMDDDIGDGDGDDEEEVMDPLATGGENDADRLMELGGL